MITSFDRYERRSRVPSGFLRTQDRRLAFSVALMELQRTRTLTQALLRPLGLTQKDFREHRMQHGPAKQRAMNGLLGYLDAFTLRNGWSAWYPMFPLRYVDAWPDFDLF